MFVVSYYLSLTHIVMRSVVCLFQLSYGFHCTKWWMFGCKKKKRYFLTITVSVLMFDLFKIFLEVRPFFMDIFTNTVVFFRYTVTRGLCISTLPFFFVEIHYLSLIRCVKKWRGACQTQEGSYVPPLFIYFFPYSPVCAFVEAFCTINFQANVMKKDPPRGGRLFAI